MPSQDHQEETARCKHFVSVLGRVSDKWSLLVVHALDRGPLRFNALRREVGAISQKVLASTLRGLEENGFVSRTVTPVTPPQVEYALTALGLDFVRPVRALATWVLANSDRMEAAKAAFKDRNASAAALPPHTRRISMASQAPTMDGRDQ